jgi:hypothetical protein
VSDIKGFNRQFEVWISYSVGNGNFHKERVVIDVDAGNDAELICHEVCVDMMSNVVESGWIDVKEAEK